MHSQLTGSRAGENIMIDKLTSNSKPSQSDPANLMSGPFLHENESAPVFREPWQAQAFAMVLKLHEQGHFSWNEWAEALSQAIAKGDSAGDSQTDTGEHYYQYWLVALETLITRQGLASSDDLDARQLAWKRAHQNTPHGEPVALANAVINDGHEH